ncbi:hypothetical protein OO17_01630 [Rhodopseudomonas palustris]|uniref:Uncharacterized protein n=1 Tax=Rhodopseudomonas palustris TaxID=1076 RepID=A0A0D7F562_RHOPL|nr:hypothetical protein OO17_01630 [Rhodopseudomonas palustris]
MVENTSRRERNIVDFVNYQRALRRNEPTAIGNRCCRHCGAALGEGESEDDCSTAGIAVEQAGWARQPRRFRAD